MESRIEKYKEYRKSIINSTVSVPVLKTPTNTSEFKEEIALYNKLLFNKRIINSFVIFLIAAIIALLVIFGVRIF